ncbi:MAG: DUF3298 domain-containing protein, partial [Clostridium butyricum]|nr:DUF3298 domain-containing protein [Clostridium butyricum]
LEASGNETLNYAKFINNKTGETFEYHAKKEDGSFGIFVFVGYAPQSDLFRDILETDKYGYMITNENMETKIKGVYVAGDLRPKQLRQIVTAVSDGAIAATMAERYVIELKERLGIKDEYVSKKPIENNNSNSDLGMVSRKSSLLTDGLRTQLKGVLERLEKEVTIVSIVDESNPKSIELRDLIMDISELGNKVNAEIYAKGENIKLENKIKADNDSFLSIEIIKEEIQASSYTTKKHYTIDKNKQIVLTLPMLFEGDNYIEEISNDIKAQMIENMKKDSNLTYFLEADENEEVIDSFDKIKENQDFYINNDGNLVICFDQYEVAPGYMGTLEFIISDKIFKK